MHDKTPHDLPADLRALGFPTRAVLEVTPQSDALELLLSALDPEGLVPADPAASVLSSVKSRLDLLEIAVRTGEVDGGQLCAELHAAIRGIEVGRILHVRQRQAFLAADPSASASLAPGSAKRDRTAKR